MYNWYSSYADLSIPSASVPTMKQKCTKPYDSFPNIKSVNSHHNSKSSIVCTNCFSTICKPIRISDPEILVYWTYQEWEGSVRLPVGDTPWDVSGFVRLFYIMSKNKIFCNFSDKYSIFLANNIINSINYHNFFFKNLLFVEIKNKRTKPDTSLTIFNKYITNPYSLAFAFCYSSLLLSIDI